MTDQQLSDADIETRLSWLLTLPPFDPILIRPMTEIRGLRELKARRAQRCVSCKHYAYYDGALCGLRDSETWLWEVQEAPDEWSCTDWEATE